MGCTTILVGKKASFDGSTMVARTEDSGASGFDPKKFVLIKANDQVQNYRSKSGLLNVQLPKKALRYTATPNASDDEGVWACAGVNEKNVAMTATETITSNVRVLAADPLVETGIGEEDIVSLVLPYIESARDGVTYLGALLEKYGTYEKNGIGFHDEDEVWWLETIGGHNWIAKRVPDDSYVVMPNQLGIDNFDLEDAYNEKLNHMCSDSLKDLIDDNFLNPSFDKESSIINPRLVFGSQDDSDRVYNTPRAWAVQRLINPNSLLWDGEKAQLKPESFEIPWSRKPENKITVEKIKQALSLHYQGTEYDVYSDDGKKKYRPIGVNRNNVLVLTQIRPYMPAAIKAIQWMAFGSTVFNAIVPFYANITRTPDYLANTGKRVSTDNFYWTNRLIAALADSNFKENLIFIERYQNKLLAEVKRLVINTDKKILDDDLSFYDACPSLEEANEQISMITKKMTDDLLDQVLRQSSLLMKNAFKRSDA
ncbi:MAG: C69 family dipeptidase [Tissierellia bacterium]|nr:C69 family dipeptidase [Tissierellia bacterium]